MSTNLSSEIRERIGRYLASDDTLQEFRRWFRASALTATDESGDPDDEQLVYTIELVLSEFEHGDWTEGELRAKLKELVATRAKSL